MALTNSSQFSQIFLANAAGTSTEITQWITGVDPAHSNTDTNVSTFAQGGLPVTESHLRGANILEVQAKGLFDPSYAKILRQVIAARSGTNYIQKAGSNATPAQGDELYNATMCPLSFTLTYNFGANATIDADLKLADGASLPTMGAI